jgi:hypothetical protein
MNRNRRIVIVSAIGIVALVVTTGWTVLAGEAWPPEPYQVYSMTRQWTTPGANTLFRIGPEDQNGTGLAEAIHLSYDLTFGNMMPTATYSSPVYFRYVRTGPNTWQFRGYLYFEDDAKPAPTILFVSVIDATATMTAPGEMEFTKTISSYTGSQDKDLDGLPDPDEVSGGGFPPDTTHWTAN